VAILPLHDGRVLIDGEIWAPNRFGGLCMLHEDGSVDDSFPRGRPLVDVNDYTECGLLRLPDGRLLVNHEPGGDQGGVSLLWPNGTRDTNFFSNATRVESFALNSDGSILVGGRYTRIDGVPRNGMPSCTEIRIEKSPRQRCLHSWWGVRRRYARKDTVSGARFLKSRNSCPVPAGIDSQRAARLPFAF
jgi:Domain of unknown function (DUF5122) beta-propeller